MPADTPMVLVPEVEYEVWQDDMPVASADGLSDAQHYMAMYGQDGPVKAMTAFTYRVPGFTAELPRVVRTDRAAELPIYLDALEEWGCDDTGEQAREILRFLASETGVAQWREEGHEEPAPSPGEGDAPVAWLFELASNINPETREYGGWSEPKVSLSKPCVPEGSIRNLTPLYTRPAPSPVAWPTRAQFAEAIENAHNFDVALDNVMAPRPTPATPEGPSFLGHLVETGGQTEFVPAGREIVLMRGRGKVTPVYDGPQNVTATPEGLREKVEIALRAYRLRTVTLEAATDAILAALQPQAQGGE